MAKTAAKPAAPTETTIADPTIAALFSQMQQVIRQNQELEARLAKYEIAPPPVVAKRRYRFRELYRKWVKDGLPALVAEGELSQGTADLYARLMSRVLLTRVTLPEGHEGYRDTNGKPSNMIRIGSLFHDEMTKKTGASFRATLKASPARTKDGKPREGVFVRDNTINRYITCIMSCLSWHDEDGFKLGLNPMGGVKMADDRPFKRVTLVTLDQWVEHIRDVAPVARDIAYVMFRTGMRPTETRELLKREWDPHHLTINLSDRKGCKTGARSVVVPSDVAEILNRRAAESNGAYIFVDPDDPRMSRVLSQPQFDYRMKKARKTSSLKGERGENIVPYNARHGGAAVIVAGARSLADAAAQLGNTPKTIVDHYLHFSADKGARDHLRNNLEKETAPPADPPPAATDASRSRRPPRRGMSHRGRY